MSSSKRDMRSRAYVRPARTSFPAALVTLGRRENGDEDTHHSSRPDLAPWTNSPRSLSPKLKLNHYQPKREVREFAPIDQALPTPPPNRSTIRGGHHRPSSASGLNARQENQKRCLRSSLDLDVTEPKQQSTYCTQWRD